MRASKAAPQHRPNPISSPYPSPLPLTPSKQGGRGKGVEMGLGHRVKDKQEKDILHSKHAAYDANVALKCFFLLLQMYENTDL